ncbi:hypothetical protein [Microbulbifer sp. JTAC008]|uniref:hypothetical protein n=1 Tax=unclassified Microbulbifer TaxID=2619833 RepID=UPI004039AF6E
MNKEFLDHIISYIYFPSLGALLLATLFSPIGLKGLSKFSKLARFSVGVYLSITIAACSALLAFSYGGCFENCSESVDDEIGIFIASIINFIGAVFVFRFLSKNWPNKQKQGAA